MAGSAGATGSGQSQPTEGHGDQPQHQGHSGADYSVAGAGTTFSDGQIQPAVDHCDQPRDEGHDSPHSPVTAIPQDGLISRQNEQPREEEE